MPRCATRGRGLLCFRTTAFLHCVEMCTERLAVAWHFLRLYRRSGGLRRMAELHYFEAVTAAGRFIYTVSKIIPDPCDMFK